MGAYSKGALNRGGDYLKIDLEVIEQMNVFLIEAPLFSLFLNNDFKYLFQHLHQPPRLSDKHLVWTSISDTILINLENSN